MLFYPHPRTPAEYDFGYSNRITPAVVARWETYFRERSAEVLKTRAPVELAYGPHPRHKIDLFRSTTAKPDAPTMIAIHGGLWFLFDRWMMHFLVPAFTAAGVHVACPSYRLAPDVGLDEIVEDARAAVVHLHRAASELGLNRDRLSVLGHSAAGQLAAIVASTDWSAYDRSLPPTLVKKWTGVSGFYDIEPFEQTTFQPLVGFSHAAYQRWNPPRHIRPGLPPALLVTGGDESQLLHEMMAGYAALLKEAAIPTDIMDVPNECHFSVLAKVGDSASPVHQAVLRRL
jgi:arylformamidase